MVQVLLKNDAESSNKRPPTGRPPESQAPLLGPFSQTTLRYTAASTCLGCDLVMERVGGVVRVFGEERKKNRYRHQVNN
jgi:hypothetical protein